MASTISAGITTTTALSYSADTSGVLQLQTNGTTTAVTIDTAQNFGLGVTPSAWGGTSKAFQLPAGSLESRGSTITTVQNAYYNGTNWIYSSTAAATLLAQTGGAHYFYNAPSGTAGNAITFTQAMTLDASGGLQLGVTSSDAKLYVTNGASPASRLIVGGGGGAANTLYTVLAGGNNIEFETGGSERARIDNSGNLLVGTTSTVFSEKFNATQSANLKAGLFFNTNASFTNNVLNLRASRNTTNSSYGFLQCSIDGVADKLYIYDSGNVVNANNSYGSISDIKLKENIVDATPKLEDLCKVKVRQYNLKSDPNHKQIGVVAQELEEVFAGLVDETIDRDQEGKPLETTTKSVKYSVFVPMLIKAIQEISAQVTTLQSQVTALQAKG